MWRMRAAGISRVSMTHARKLRRAEKALRRWHACQCGIDCGGRATYTVERSDDTGAWCGVIRYDNGDVRREPVADIGAATERRVAALCEALGAQYYIQGDPRGAALWVDSKPIPDDNHTGAVCCAID